MNLGEGLCIFTSFLFPRFWTLSIESFWFLFWSILNGWGQKMDQGSMDPLFGPGPWTTFMDRVHGPPDMDQVHGQFFYFYKVLHQVHGHSETEIVPKKDLTRRCRPMLTIDHKYLVVLTRHTLCLHMCSRKTVKLSWFKSYRQERNYALQYKDSHHPYKNKLELRIHCF